MKHTSLFYRLALSTGAVFLIIYLFFSGSEPASAETSTFTPVADAFVIEPLPTANTGEMPLLRVQSSPDMQAYLRFNVENISGEVSSAVLNFYMMDSNADGLSVYVVESDNWQEGTISFENAPEIGQHISSNTQPAVEGTWITLDVSSYVTGEGVYSFAVTSETTDLLRWYSREDEHQPELVVSDMPLPTGTTTPQATNTPLPTATPTPQPTPPPVGSIIVDHTAVDLFYSIPDQYIEAAAGMPMLFIDRSVGANINDGLTCLSYPSDEDAPNHCARFEHNDPAYSVDPSVVNWERPGGYDRSHWEFRFWEGTSCSNWDDKVNCFMQMTSPDMAAFEVVSFQYSYLAVDHDSTIADQPGGYFWDNPARYDVYDQEGYEAEHGDTIFIYWTTSLSRGLGSGVADAFNDQMRAYAVANGKPLFDVADILSHDPDGNPCFDNRDGVPYDNGNQSENYPDDGVAYRAICPHYTTEVDGGHLGSVSAGKIRVAQAFWVLMAQLAGWDGTPEP